MLSNTTAIAEAWARLDHKFALMYAREPSSTGTLGRAWRRASSPRPGRILLLSRRIMRRSDWTLLTPEMTVARNTEYKSQYSTFTTFTTFGCSIWRKNKLFLN